MNFKKQDIQTHTNFSDGKNTIMEMLDAAVHTGLKSIVISDHAKGWISGDGTKSEFFSTYARYTSYLQQIENAKDVYSDKIKVFSGLEIEVNIQGDLKLDEGILEYAQKYKNQEKFGVDILLGSIHSESFEEDCKEYKIKDQDKRVILIENMINLIRNKKIDVFTHPFQALHGQFSDNLTEKEMERIIDAFEIEWQSGHNIFFELNGKKYPEYEQWSYNKYEKGELETHDVNFLHLYKMRGGKFVLGSDAHSIRGLTETDFSVLNKLSLKESEIFMFL